MALKLKRSVVEDYQAEQNKTKHYTILLVDDEKANLEGLAKILDENYNIIIATDGVMALDIIKSLNPSEKIHLIISDQRMPKMTGVELFEQTVLLMPESIRIILTGFSDIDVIIDSINRGAVYKFLTKPIEPIEICLTIQRAIESLELIELNASLEHKMAERTRELAEKQYDLERTNTKLQQQIAIVERLSITDELTQLYNRRYFNTLFPKEIKRTSREKIPLSFLMLDLDYFKQYNDHYGHQKGDDVLRTIGFLLKSQCLRASDSPLRLGGEEFGVIFTNLNAVEAFIFANKIRQAIEDTQIEHLFSSTANHITASFGLVTLATGATLSMDDFYKYADGALYQAKESGRNKIIQVMPSKIFSLSQAHSLHSSTKE